MDLIISIILFAVTLTEYSKKEAHTSKEKTLWLVAIGIITFIVSAMLVFSVIDGNTVACLSALLSLGLLIPSFVFVCKWEGE